MPLDAQTLAKRCPISVLKGVILQEMRTYKEAEEAGKEAGLTLLNSYDVATDSCVAGPWCAASPNQTVSLLH